MKQKYIYPLGENKIYYPYGIHSFEKFNFSTDISSLRDLKISCRVHISVGKTINVTSESRRDDILKSLTLLQLARTCLFFILFYGLTPSFAQRIAILGAMPEEIQLLESQLTKVKTKNILGFQFKTGKLNGK